MLLHFALNPAKLSPASRAFAEALFRAVPWLKLHARMSVDVEEEPEETPSTDDFASFELYVDAPSPSQQQAQSLTIWLDESAQTRSFRFAHHVETSDDDAELIALIKALCEERALVAYNADDPARITSACFTLKHQDEALLELFTASESAPQSLRIISWSGELDRDLSIDEL